MRNRTFLFFSLIMAARISIFLRHHISKNDRFGLLTSSRDSHHDGDGQLLGTQRATGDVPRSRHTSSLPPRAFGCGHARVQHSANYILVLPSVAIEILVTKFVLHMHGWGNLWAIFLLLLSLGYLFLFRSDRCERDDTMQETQVTTK